MFSTTEVKYHVRSRIRAYGKARIDIAKRARSRQEWDTLWKRPQYNFPFEWGQYWKQCVEYRVDDFAAEVGFYIDVLGLPVNAFNPDYAMFTSPQGDFFFSVVPAPAEGFATPPDAFRMQFMVEDIFKTTAELERRGITFEQSPTPVSDESEIHIGYFRTPHGICIDLWGITHAQENSLDQIEFDQQVASDESDEDPGDLQSQQETSARLETRVEPVSRRILMAEQTDEDTEDEGEEEDLFEEVIEEPVIKPKMGLAKISPSRKFIQDDEEEPEYVNVDDDESEEEDYPTYKPIPLNR